MIKRYSVSDIEKIWSDDYKYQTLLKVELSLLNTLEHMNIVPQGTTKKFDHVKICTERIKQIEATTKHDVIAFCTSITEQVEEKYARFFHYGVTSSDILDTALMLQIKECIHILIKDINRLIQAIEKQVNQTENILCIGRSHGMSAEPMIFAQKLLSFEAEIKRRLNDYQNLLNTEIKAQMSGAVGNYTILTPEIETITLKSLNLDPEPVSTQVIPRDRIAKIVGTGSLLATSLERLATEIRLLHHSDIAEVYESFTQQQKGSSTMPHKKNPISSENITGIARVIRSHQDVCLQNIPLWHERDISHSSAERLVLPDHFGLLCYLCRRATRTIKNLVINKEHIESKTTLPSSYALHQLIQKNETSREKLYLIVQKAAFETDDEDVFFKLINQQCVEQSLNTIENTLDQTHYTNMFQSILKRVRSS